jgi:hypothetical protein
MNLGAFLRIIADIVDKFHRLSSVENDWISSYVIIQEISRS